LDLIRELRKTPFTSHPVEHQPGTPILQTVGLGVRYENYVALEDISFRLITGERVAVIGPNGAGKSTLFKVIAGVLTPTHGEVKVYGSGPGGHICIAYLPQRSQVDWSFPVNVTDVVMMGRIGKLGMFRWPSRKDWSFVQGCLEDVRMGDLAKRQIGELSGGQQQRMFIARALAQEAELMLMDEPLTGLDIQSQETIFRIMEDLRQRSVTIMISTHDLDQAAGRFDRVMLMNRRLIGFGSPENVFTPEQLRAAYGGHLRMVQVGDETLVVADTCCDEGEGMG
jgi:manganese/iron transport system ATP-binding protein